MCKLTTEIENKFRDSDDFFIEQEWIGQTVVHLIGLKTLIDLPKTRLYIQQNERSSSSMNHFFKQLSNKLDVGTEQLIAAISEGKLVIISKDNAYNAIVEPFGHNLGRSIQTPNIESPIQAAMDAFVEEIAINVGLIRKRLSTDKLCHQSYEVGDLQKRKISMLYIQDGTPQNHIEKLDFQLKQIKGDIENLNDFNKIFGQRWYNPVSPTFVTELPFQAVHLLKKNRVVMFIDNYPFAIASPHLLWDMFGLEGDWNFPYLINQMLRTLRVIGAILSLILPALYVALVSVNPEVLKIDLALFVAKSREGVPYPALLETLQMIILIDLILEAIVRLPKSMGPSVTMVGGVILGQAVVETNLVSNLLIIVIAAIVISNSTIIGTHNALLFRLLRYPILFMAAIFGILGVFIGLISIGIYLAGQSSNGIPYTALKIDQEGDAK